MAVPTSTSHLTCRCSAVHEPGTLLQASTFPILAPEICHCNPCRYTTGSLGASFPALKSRPSTKSLEACTAYASSETHNRYFCSTCGTPTFVEVKNEGKWYCLAGIVERDPEKVGEGEEWVKGKGSVVEVSKHQFVGDTGDGGIAARLLRIGGRDVECWKEWDDVDGGKMSREEVLEWEERADKVKVAGVEELMEARCHCGGVDLRVTRANFEADQQGRREGFREAGDKYIAMFCACRSCRLQSGVSLQPWVYIPPQNFRVAATGKEVVFGRPGSEKGMTEGTSLKHYWSTKEVCRSFCGRCGASFCYWFDGRPQVVDLSMGVVRAKSGAMAREWVSWRWIVTGKEECDDVEMMEAIVREE